MVNPKIDKNKVKKYSKELISYRGHLPYYILAALSSDDVKKRYEYLKSTSETIYNKEMELLKSERRNKDEKLSSLKQFLEDCPKYQDFIID